MGMGQDIDLAQFVLQLEKAIAGGVATLDGSAKVPKNQISLTASDVGAIATETDPTVSSFTKGLTTNDAVLTAVNASSGTISTNKLPDLSWNKITTDIPTPITVLRNNQTPPNWSYWLFGNFYGQYWELMQAAISSVANTIALRTSNGSIFGSRLVANGGTQSTSTTTGDSVVSGGQGVWGDQYVGGSINGGSFNLSALNTAPASSASIGIVGQIRIDANHIYICTAVNTWKRVAITTW